MNKKAPSRTLKTLKIEQLPEITGHLEDFLSWLNQPSCITLTGEDTSRHRIICTLIHGNEPSGAVALHRWLRAWQSSAVERPKTNVSFILPSVEACLLHPRFNHRHFPGRRDLNRCFSGPNDDAEGELAANILTYIHDHSPEAVLDLHNTSGSGPAFAVSNMMDDKHRALTSFFTQKMVYSNLKLGALTEIGEHLAPSVTIECGGAQDEEAHLLAYEGIVKFLAADDPFSGDPANLPITIYENPLRLKLKPGCSIAYGSQTESADLVLRTQAEALNYKPVSSGDTIGWLGTKGLGALVAQSPCGEDHLDTYFEQTPENQLRARCDLQLFMVTPRADIALSDCVFYFSPI